MVSSFRLLSSSDEPDLKRKITDNNGSPIVRAQIDCGDTQESHELSDSCCDVSEQKQRTAVLCVVVLVEVVHAFIGGGGTALAAAVSSRPWGTCICTPLAFCLPSVIHCNVISEQVDP